MRINESMVLGLDIGIGSVGWCLLQRTEDSLGLELLASHESGGQIVPSLGARCMDVPENAKDKELLNVKRRQSRLMRRVTHRRAQRVRAVRRLLAEKLCPTVLEPDAFHLRKGKGSQLEPWSLRAQGLQRVLTDEEFATVLLHLCKHRGFKSNSKRDAKDKEGGAVLTATKAMTAHLEEQESSTFGAYMAMQPQKRNRSGYDGASMYTHTPLRSLIEQEARQLFAKQRELGNAKATGDWEEEYITQAFTQRPLASWADLTGFCTFLENEKRAPRFAPTAERFRLAQRLCALRIKTGNEERGLDPSQIRHVLGLLGEQKGVTYKALRKRLELPASAEFAGLGARSKGVSDPEGQDVVGKSKPCGMGSYAFCRRLGREAYARLRDLRLEDGTPCLDNIARILSDNDDKQAIVRALQALPLTPEELAALGAGVDEGDFADFKGVLNLSLKAMSVILPEMINSGDYAKGCELAGFDHTQTRRADWRDVRNPVVLRILRETRKQFHAIIREFGAIPGRIHVELARDMGKSAEERGELERGLNKRSDALRKAREELAEHFGCTPESITFKELRSYELWRQQGGKCAYYLLLAKTGSENLYAGTFKDGGIPVAMLRDTARMTEIDHILPRSRTSDNSYHNQALCVVGANQRKGNRTPYEWLGKDHPEAWHAFEEWVKRLPGSGFKKRNFLMNNLDTEKEERFHARNLHDTSYAARLVMSMLEDEMTKLGVSFTQENGQGKRRIFARPGSVTAYLRRHWGVENLKRDAAGKRHGDRHHALDALILAACGEGLLQRVTAAHKAGEQGKKEAFPSPMLTLPALFRSGKSEEPLAFRDGAELALEHVMVSRAERAKTKGALHEETLRAVRVEKAEDGTEVQMLYERKSIASLAEKDLERIKDKERCPDLIEKLRAWIQAGKPKDNPPYVEKTNGDTGEVTKDYIRRVRLRRGPFTSGVLLKRGSGTAQADNARWVRADVYQKEGKYYIVPVYTWQAAAGICPDRAAVAGKVETEWPIMDETFTFLFSLSQNAYVLVDRKGVETKGYYIGSDKSTASITLADANDKEQLERGIGVKTLRHLEKYRVDRMGRRHRVLKEPRP